MLGDALKYPRRGDDWLMRTVIGGILVLAGGLILIPLIIVEGYVYRVLGSVTRGDGRPPEWEEWIELFVEGIQMYIIQIAYVIIPLLFLGLGGLITVFGFFADSGLAIIGLPLLFAGGVLQLLAIYLIPAAITNFAYHESIGAGFDFRTIANVAFSLDYFVAVVLAFILAIILGMIGSVLAFIIVGFFILFYLQIVVAYLFARGFTAAGGVSNVA